MKTIEREQERLSVQQRLDSEKSQAERNRLGQFATPTALARDIVQGSLALLASRKPIRFLDPAIGTGSFFSALVHSVPLGRIQAARGFEVDTHYGEAARNLWGGVHLDVELADFTRAEAPRQGNDRFNLLICNPPYVRHHHIVNGEKVRLRKKAEAACGVGIPGLAGLYCYFLCLSHAWMQSGAVAGWLIPSEFMDVNYGAALKQYLLERVTLLRIHRFDPNDVQFDDALVSSAVIWFRNDPPSSDHEVEFTFGCLLEPALSRSISSQALRDEAKWTRFPAAGLREGVVRYRLSDIFEIKRGIATGDNGFFILTKDELQARRLPYELFRPVLPSPRYLLVNEIDADHDGSPILDRQLFVLDCHLSEQEVRRCYPTLWSYLEGGKGTVSERYLCRSRDVWYSQEKRSVAPLLCTYLGRSGTKSGRPFRFILNHSRAIATNVYLMLYPKPALARAIGDDSTLLTRLWEILNHLPPRLLLGEGRVYGGGLHKLEPKELGNVDAGSLLEAVPDLREEQWAVQRDLFK